MNHNTELKRAFISYPKSGRSWIRFALIKAGLPNTVHFHHDEFEFNDGNKPELSFSSELRLEKYEDVDRIVYLERDPRDVICSLFYQVTGRFKDFFNYNGSMSDFIRDPYFGAENLKKFHQMWADICSKREVLKVTYEDMTANSEKVLTDIIKFYEFGIEAEQIKFAAQESSFDNMKKIEQSEQFEQPWLKPRNNSLKVRSGKVGGFINELNQDDQNYLNALFNFN